MCRILTSTFASFARRPICPLLVSHLERIQRGAGQGFHIQHVNSIHNRIRKWPGNTFWGVSTKYLQQYMNWRRLKEDVESRSDRVRAFVEKTMDIGLGSGSARKDQNMKIQYQRRTKLEPRITKKGTSLNYTLQPSYSQTRIFPPFDTL